jgi:hypothetical protein
VVSLCIMSVYVFFVVLLCKYVFILKSMVEQSPSMMKHKIENTPLSAENYVHYTFLLTLVKEMLILHWMK